MGAPLADGHAPLPSPAKARSCRRSIVRRFNCARLNTSHVTVAMRQPRPCPPDRVTSMSAANADTDIGLDHRRSGPGWPRPGSAGRRAAWPVGSRTRRSGGPGGERRCRPRLYSGSRCCSMNWSSRTRWMFERVGEATPALRPTAERGVPLAARYNAAASFPKVLRVRRPAPHLDIPSWTYEIHRQSAHSGGSASGVGSVSG